MLAEYYLSPFLFHVYPSEKTSFIRGYPFQIKLDFSKVKAWEAALPAHLKSQSSDPSRDRRPWFCWKHVDMALGFLVSHFQILLWKALRVSGDAGGCGLGWGKGRHSLTHTQMHTPAAWLLFVYTGFQARFSWRDDSASVAPKWLKAI